RQEKQGAGHWETWDACFQVAELKRLRQRPAEERQQLRQAVRLTTTGEQRYREGRYAEAGKLFRQALAIREQALPAGHLDRGTSLNKGDASLNMQGQYAEAEKLYRRALAIWENALPAGHRDLAHCLQSLALTLHKRGQYADAEKLYRRALAIWEKAL